MNGARARGGGAGVGVGTVGAPILVILDANGAKQSDHPLSTQYTTFLGKAVGGINGIRIEGPEVANTHCKVEVADQSFVIVNLAAGGTLVNGTQVTRAQLSDGDIISMGSVKICFSHAPSRSETIVEQIPAATVAAASDAILLATVPMLSPMPTEVQIAVSAPQAADGAPGATVPVAQIPAPDAGATTICPSCRAVVRPGRAFCTQCGTRIQKA